MGKTAEATADGCAIADAAARLTLRNRILIETIVEGQSFDVDRLVPFARETLLALAEEQERAASRAKRQRKKASGQHSDSDGTHDYRDRDVRNLRRRERQYLRVAKTVRTWAEDESELRRLIAAARIDAWGDIEANLHRRLGVFGARPERDSDYEQERDRRLHDLVSIDLARLAEARPAAATG